MTSTAKKTTRRQMIEDARRAAIDGRWEEAIAINQQLIERTPRDAAAFNRLGKAHFELNQLPQATEAYTGALKIDPANMIARSNLQRLEQLRRAGHERPDRHRQLVPRAYVFIQEVGKTWVDELVNPAAIDELADVSSGEALELKVENGRLLVLRSDGVRLGEIEARTAERVIELMEAGNRYECYALGTAGASLRIILREVYRDPSRGNKISFPKQISQTSQYLRERDVLRQRDEADFLFNDEDDEESEEEETVAPVSDELEGLVADRTPFMDEPLGVEDEENPAYAGSE